MAARSPTATPSGSCTRAAARRRRPARRPSRSGRGRSRTRPDRGGSAFAGKVSKSNTQSLLIPCNGQLTAFRRSRSALATGSIMCRGWWRNTRKHSWSGVPRRPNPKTTGHARDGVEGAHPEQVLLERADEALGTAIPLGGSHEGGRTLDAQEGKFLL